MQSEYIYKYYANIRNKTGKNSLKQKIESMKQEDLDPSLGLTLSVTHFLCIFINFGSIKFALCMQKSSLIGRKVNTQRNVTVLIVATIIQQHMHSAPTNFIGSTNNETIFLINTCMVTLCLAGGDNGIWNNCTLMNSQKQIEKNANPNYSPENYFAFELSRFECISFWNCSIVRYLFTKVRYILPNLIRTISSKI